MAKAWNGASCWNCSTENNAESTTHTHREQQSEHNGELQRPTAASNEDEDKVMEEKHSKGSKNQCSHWHHRARAVSFLNRDSKTRKLAASVLHFTTEKRALVAFISHSHCCTNTRPWREPRCAAAACRPRLGCRTGSASRPSSSSVNPSCS